MKTLFNMCYDLKEIENWLKETNNKITHFRSKKWCGMWRYLAYNRNEVIPFISDQPFMPDNNDVYDLIYKICGNEKIEDPIN